MAKSKRTKHYGFLRFIFKTLSLVCLFLPFLIFTSLAMAEGILIAEGFSIGASVLVVGIITIICAYREKFMYSKVWIIPLVMFLIIDNFLPIFLSTAICQIVKEIIIDPLYRRFNEDYHTNKQMDKRGI